jgi:uridylate kinase
MSGASQVVKTDAPVALPGGTKIVALATTPQALVAVETKCRGVWIGARKDAAGAAVNTGRVLIGDSAGQNIPLETTDTKGMTLAIDDASKVYVKVFTNGDGVDWRIFV